MVPFGKVRTYMQNSMGILVGIPTAILGVCCGVGQSGLIFERGACRAEVGLRRAIRLPRTRMIWVWEVVFWFCLAGGEVRRCVGSEGRFWRICHGGLGVGGDAFGVGRWSKCLDEDCDGYGSMPPLLGVFAWSKSGMHFFTCNSESTSESV